MPYGTASNDTAFVLLGWAIRNNATMELEAKETDCAHESECDCNYAPDYVDVSIIVEGALDESFGIKTDGNLRDIAYAIAEFLDSENVRDYLVTLSHANGDVLYTVVREV